MSAVRIVILAGLLLVAAGCGSSTSRTMKATGSNHPEAWFEEITVEAGIRFMHDAGPAGRFLVPEQMGSGCALFDFDNDGLLDIYLIQNGGPAGSRNCLYRQEAPGKFKDVSVGSGLDIAGFGMGVAVGDMNNDGWPDVLVTEYLAARLFQNLGQGKFVEITRQAGIDNPRWATAAAFLDYDRDGWLDLVIGNYLDYDPTQKCINSQGVQDFCGPHGFPGVAARLFRNGGASHGTVRFVDMTVPSGLGRFPGPALGVLCADFNGDRWPDIFLADDGRPNRLFINRQDGTFNEEAAQRGLAYNAMGQTAGNMGIGVGDINGDGLFDIFVTHLSEELHGLWVQEARGAFQDRTAAVKLNQSLWRGTGFGAALADFDGDGDPDLAFVNGLVKRAREPREITCPLAGQRRTIQERISRGEITGAYLTGANAIPGLPAFWHVYAQRHQLFANDAGVFREISLQNTALSGQAMVGRGLACGDVDNDGRVDLLITGTAGPAQLLRNVSARSNHWLMVRAVDPALGGRDAYGAEITVHIPGGRRWALVQPGSSYLSSSDPRAHFGLGAETAVQSIRVLWPDGQEEEFPASPADTFLTLGKGTGRRKS